MFDMYLFSAPSVFNPLLDIVNFSKSAYIRVCACVVCTLCVCMWHNVHIYHAHACVCKHACVYIRCCVCCTHITLHTFDAPENALPKNANMETSVYYTYIRAYTSTG